MPSRRAPSQPRQTPPKAPARPPIAHVLVTAEDLGDGKYDLRDIQVTGAPSVVGLQLLQAAQQQLMRHVIEEEAKAR